MQLTMTLARLRIRLFWLVGALVSCGLLAEVWSNTLGDGGTSEVVAFFSLSYEGNLPTWFSTCLLFSCGLLLAIVAAARRQENAAYVRHWRALALIFFYISVDEFVGIHEHLNDWFDLRGFFYFGWVIPGAAAVTVIALVYVGFLLHLPVRTRNQFLVAGAFYVGGALGVELPLGYWTDLAGDRNLVYGLVDLVEESFEMLGASLFALSLVEYLGARAGTVEIRLHAPSPARSEAR